LIRKGTFDFNVVAPGAVDTPLHADNSNDVLKTLRPMGTISTVEEIASAVVYLTDARQIRGRCCTWMAGARWQMVTPQTSANTAESAETFVCLNLFFWGYINARLSKLGASNAPVAIARYELRLYHAKEGKMDALKRAW